MYKSERTHEGGPNETDETSWISSLNSSIKYHLAPTQPLNVISYFDAAFATHDDSKSHSGVTIFVAGMLVYASSKKQKCVAKSPTESELVALTENIGLVELFEEFITLLIKDKITTPIMYQDSSSEVTLVTHGGGVTRTRHLKNHMHLAKEAVDMVHLVIKHCKAELMIADGLTKPLDGSDFTKFIQGLNIFKPQKTTGER
jgi:hypothetical protein